MNKSFLFITLIVLLLISAGCQSSSSSTEKKTENSVSHEEELSIAFSTWVGYAPFYIAEEKGFFEKNGVNVKITRIESSSDRLSALAANRIQGIGGTIDSQVVAAARDIPLVQVISTEESSGGDGIVAKKEIKSFKDLKGKKVAVQTDGGASFFWFNYLLKQEGMSMGDMDIQSMSSGDAGAAFIANKVDAAITWEPWLTNVKNTDFGHVLMTSAETPGIIASSFALQQDYVEENPDQVKGFVKSWFDAIEYFKKNEEDAISIMAKAMGQTDGEFKEALSGVTLYDKEKAREYVGTKENPGQLYELTKLGAELWTEQKIIDKEPNIEDLIDYSFIE
ncbi:ABC transporter substrate-binding protein [Peribacillus sp. NPDC097198]|uniref:ABC transporter substrate-binding protein n=1 Tax=Peribacillus sp. NPDC097198 TaxID=3364397 RepID=UPI0038234335